MLKTNEPLILEQNIQFMRGLLIEQGISEAVLQKPHIDKASQIMEFKHFLLTKEQVLIIMDFVK